MNDRTALHDRYTEVARVGDASRLSYLHGPTTAWTEEEIAALWERAVSAQCATLDPLNSIYIHVPFCKSICHFCNYDRLQPSSPDLLRTWLDRVLRSIRVIGPKVRPLAFHAVYLGGGTPSVLPARLLGELLDALDAAFSFHRGAMRKLEFDPMVMNLERLEVLAAHGFNELSFGIETLDPEINARHNRGHQGIEAIERCFRDLRAVGISDVACDFLLGLAGTTPEGMLEEIETVLRRFQPESLDIFMLTPTLAYVDSHFGGSWEAFWAHLKPFEAAVPVALPGLAARTGYHVQMGQGHHMGLTRLGRKNQDRRYAYSPLTSEANRPVNVVGLGRSARSVIFGVAAFAAADPGDDPRAKGPSEYAGNLVDVAGEVRAFFAYLLRDRDTVDRSEFRRIFGSDIPEVIPAALAGWEKEGTARLEERVLRFVPQDRRARIRSLLWLVPEESIEFDLARFDRLELSPSGIARLAAPMHPGMVLDRGHRFDGVDGTRLLLRTPAGRKVRYRVAPGLPDRVPLRPVLETDLAPRDADALGTAVSHVCRVLIAHHRKLSRRLPVHP